VDISVASSRSDGILSPVASLTIERSDPAFAHRVAAGFGLAGARDAEEIAFYGGVARSDMRLACAPRRFKVTLSGA
jgi:hypothetical protein